VRNQFVGVLIAGVAVCMMSSVVLAQSGSWLPCPRCQTDAQRAAAENVTDQPFDALDLSGVWGRGGVRLSDDVPPMTAWGQAKFDAAKPGMGPRAVPLGNDPMMLCDPLGYPRWLNYNYGMEFIHLPNRTLQFFEVYHTHRTIWTDGRGLPEDPEPRWLGYSVGTWEGDTFIVESSGFDERSWLDTQGHQHSEAMSVVEHYRRLSHGSLEVTLTIDDPQTYTEVWVTTATVSLSPGTEMGEYFCVPSDEALYRSTVREPAGGITER
jgi:hypothetical protein